MFYSIKGFLETSFSDWPGKVAAVLFLPYCNFRCLYCHNYELLLYPEKFPDFPLPEIIKKISLNRDWIDGICITGGEPTIHRWLPALIRFLKEKLGRDMLIKLDTNGSAPHVLKKLIQEGLVDYVAMDFKAPLTVKRYEEVIGVSLGEEGLINIQKSMEILLTHKVDHEFRTTIVPSLLKEKEIYEMAKIIKGAKRYTLQNFNPRQTLAETLRNSQSLDESTLQKLQKKVTEIIRANNCMGKSQITKKEIPLNTLSISCAK